MSRKTSSIVNRLNITYFWNFQRYTNYISLFKLFNIFKIIKGFLYLNNLYLIFYFFKKSCFNSLNFTIVVYFFKKYVNLEVINFYNYISVKFKLLYFENYFNFFLFNQFKIVSCIFVNLYSFIVSLNNFFLYLYLFKCIKIILLRLFFLFSNLEVKFKFLDHVNNGTNLLKFKQNFVIIKSIELYFKKVLCRYFNNNIEINIINIFNLIKQSNYHLTLKFFNFYKIKNLPFFWSFINIFYLSLLFNRLDLIVLVIAENLSRKEKTQKKYLNSIIKILAQIYRQKMLPIKGMRLVISGKIDCKIRKKFISFTKGKLGLQVLESKLLYSLISHDTKFGVISIRFWLSKF